VQRPSPREQWCRTIVSQRQIEGKEEWARPNLQLATTSGGGPTFRDTWSATPRWGSVVMGAGDATAVLRRCRPADPSDTDLLASGAWSHALWWSMPSSLQGATALDVTPPLHREHPMKAGALQHSRYRWERSDSALRSKLNLTELAAPVIAICIAKDVARYEI
jgi:hypothetical protein